MKKVLILTYDFPYPTNSGGKSRIYNLIKFAKNKDLEFFLYSFVRFSFKQEYKKNIEDIGVSHIYTHPRKNVKDVSVIAKTAIGKSSIFKNLYFEKKAMEEILRIVKDEKIEVVLFESFYTSFYISRKLKETGVIQIFGTENIEHALYFDFANKKPGILKEIFMRQVERVRFEEEAAYKNADMVLAVTQEESDYISKSTKSKVCVVPNGVDTKELAYKEKKYLSKNLLFVGNFSYFPNVDAMRFFYHEVFLQLPEVMLTVVGKNQDALPFLKTDTRIKNIEYVEDIKDVYYEADIFVFPVRLGGGTNFKLLEAASCGVPIIALPERVAGLGFEENKEYVAAKSSQDFVFGINNLLDNKLLRNKISKNARLVVEEKYDWAEIGKKLRDILTA